MSRTDRKFVSFLEKLNELRPALGNRQVAAEIRLIETKGEYAGWRATRATGDFDLRTFQIRAYPVEKIAELRPGTSAYADWAGSRPCSARPRDPFSA